MRRSASVSSEYGITTEQQRDRGADGQQPGREQVGAALGDAGPTGTSAATAIASATPSPAA